MIHQRQPNISTVMPGMMILRGVVQHPAHSVCRPHVGARHQHPCRCPYRLEKLSRYETHLDRKFERTLAMLIKLKDLRSSRAG